MTLPWRIIGLETEYAIDGWDERGEHIPRELVLEHLFALAKESLPHLPDGTGGMFLENGSRLYIDTGTHPELATPECPDPWQLVRYMKAGEVILSGLVDQLVGQNPEVSQVVLWKGNIDYSGTRTSWGCHESYLHTSLRNRLPHNLMPHLVSRIIYTGAGGFDPFSPGLGFMVSPRVAHLELPISPDSTGNRGIYHAKDESLAQKGYRRLHLICGESLCSEKATLLKVGTTALMVILIEAGFRPGKDVQLLDPVNSMHRLAHDPSCRSPIRLARGVDMTALELQRHYYDQVRNHLSESFMPSWAEPLCQIWKETLDQLEQGPQGVAVTCDWAMKLTLYRQFAEKRGFPMNSWNHWNHVASSVQGLTEILSAKKSKVRGSKILVEEGDQARLMSKLKDQGVSIEVFSDFLKFRQELFELDVRFSQVRPQGLFAEIDQEGVLAHRVANLDSVPLAVNTPPSEGRAFARGHWVSQLSKEHADSSSCLCDWTSIVDPEANRNLDLGNPFESNPTWQPLTNGAAKRMALARREPWHHRLRLLRGEFG